MTAFKEFGIGKFVLRFYKTDHVWTCTVTEDMLDEVKKELALQRLSDIGQEIENEPLAWMVDGVLFTSLGAALNISFVIEQPCIPLYTPPNEDRDSAIYATGYWKGIAKVKPRELTDKEIKEAFAFYFQGLIDMNEINYQGAIIFVKEMLKKASEK